MQYLRWQNIYSIADCTLQLQLHMGHAQCTHNRIDFLLQYPPVPLPLPPSCINMLMHRWMFVYACMHVWSRPYCRYRVCIENQRSIWLSHYYTNYFILYTVCSLCYWNTAYSQYVSISNFWFWFRFELTIFLLLWLARVSLLFEFGFIIISICLDFLLSNTAFFSLVQTQKRGKKHQVLHKQSFFGNSTTTKTTKMLRPVKQCSSIFHAVIPFFSLLFWIIIIMKFLKRIHSSLNVNFTVSKHTHTKTRRVCKWKTISTCFVAFVSLFFCISFCSRPNGILLRIFTRHFCEYGHKHSSRRLNMNSVLIKCNICFATFECLFLCVDVVVVNSLELDCGNMTKIISSGGCGGGGDNVGDGTNSTYLKLEQQQQQQIETSKRNRINIFLVYYIYICMVWLCARFIVFRHFVRSRYAL